jgi:S-adenosylmethionine:tRNA ribosyltransferase-isomerase
MIAADHPDPSRAKLLSIGGSGEIRHLPRTALADLFRPGDLVVANDAATLPASLMGHHVASGAPIELRLAGWIAVGDPTLFIAIAFGAGDYRQRTEERLPPPALTPGDRLTIGPLTARVERRLDHPRLVALRFLATRQRVFAGLAHHGRPIQYAHVPSPLALWDVWTKIAGAPIAFEPPSAAFALDWRTIGAWRRRGVGFAALSHAAGVSSTGDPLLDRRLPFDEPYSIPRRTAEAITRALSSGGRVIAIGTTVVRALESAATRTGRVEEGDGIAVGRLGGHSRLRVVDAILSGVHQPGESHYELLRAFADDDRLARMSAALIGHDYRGHEFGDSVLIERPRGS